jgi:hypothetical protein
MTSLNSSSPLRTLFLTEAILKVLGGATFILFPSTIAQNLTALPCTPLSTNLLRGLGTQTVAFSVPLFLAAWSGTLSREGRRLVYWTVLAREGFLMAGLLGGIATSWISNHAGNTLGIERGLEEGKGQVVRAEEADKVSEEKKLRRGLWLWVAELAPFVVARLWILTQREEWF